MNDDFELLPILSSAIGQLVQYVKSVSSVTIPAKYLVGLIGPPKQNFHPRMDRRLADTLSSRTRLSNHSFVEKIFYFVVEFEQLVIPTQVGVFTKMCRPIRLARIWAKHDGKREKWSLLWDKRYDDKISVSSARLYKPTIRSVRHRTRVLRFEFDKPGSYDITGLEGIALLGMVETSEEAEPVGRVMPDSISSAAGGNNMADLPNELLFKIFSHLNPSTLRVVEQVCKSFAAVTKDAYLYVEVNQHVPYEMDTDDLEWLGKRCSGIKKLNLSWCFMPKRVIKSVVKFLQLHGHTLTQLRLTSFDKGYDTSVLELCPNLTELRLHNIALSGHIVPPQINYKHLIKLDLSSSFTPNAMFVSLLQRTPHLQHLNMAYCWNSTDPNIIATIGQYNRELISLGLSLMPSRLRLMRQENLLTPLMFCTKLQELHLDVSYFMQTAGIMIELAEGYPEMRPLGLVSDSCVCHHVVRKIATQNPELQLLDRNLTYYGNVVGETVNDLLAGFPALRLLRVQHSNEIEPRWFSAWERRYPLLKIENIH